MFSKLKSNPIRLGIKEIPIPSSRSIAKDSYLNPNQILDAVSKLTRKKINFKFKKLFEDKIKKIPTDIPYNDFKGPF